MSKVINGEGLSKVYKSIVEYTKYIKSIGGIKFNMVDNQIIYKDSSTLPEYVKADMSFTITKKKLNEKDQSILNDFNLLFDNVNTTIYTEKLIEWDKIYGKIIDSIVIDGNIMRITAGIDEIEFTLEHLNIGSYSDIEFLKEEDENSLLYEDLSTGYNTHEINIDDYILPIYRNAILKIKKGFDITKKRLYKLNNEDNSDIRVVSVIIESKNITFENFYAVVKNK